MSSLPNKNQILTKGNMELKTQLENALREAMRSGNDVRKQTIRMALSAIKFTEIEKGKPVDEAGISAILQKEIKSRREAIQDAEKAHRADLVEDNKAEIDVLESFLPKQLSDLEIQELVETAISETQANGMADMGKVMKVLVPRLQGRAPGDRVSQIVRQMLQK
jgi:uncharacterized protein YqeY